MTDIISSTHTQSNTHKFISIGLVPEILKWNGNFFYTLYDLNIRLRTRLKVKNRNRTYITL